MKLRDASLLILVGIVVVAGLIGIISTKFLGDDNPVEEAAEELIKLETGKDVDLSPKHPAVAFYQEEPSHFSLPERDIRTEHPGEPQELTECREELPA